MSKAKKYIVQAKERINNLIESAKFYTVANYIKEVPTMDIIEKPVRRIDVPIAQKANLTLHEAAAYFNIGEKKLRQLTEGDRCPFVLYCGSKRLIKREMFQSYLEKQFSI